MNTDAGDCQTMARSWLESIFETRHTSFSSLQVMYALCTMHAFCLKYTLCDITCTYVCACVCV